MAACPSRQNLGAIGTDADASVWMPRVEAFASLRHVRRERGGCGILATLAIHPSKIKGRRCRERALGI